MADDVDRSYIRATIRSAGVDPDGDLAPDVDAIVAMDAPLREKCERCRAQLQENIRRRVPGVR